MAKARKKVGKKRAARKTPDNQKDTVPAESKKGDIRNRIKELRMVPAKDLIANEENWRMHPDSQVSAMKAMLNDIGYIDALIGRETEDGVMLVDGHLRKDITPNTNVPVLIVDLTEDEARRAMMTLDPLAGMAVADPFKAKDLLDKIELPDNADLRNMAYEIVDELMEMEADDAKARGEEESEGEHEHSVPGMELEPHEHYDYLLVLATNAQDWNMLCGKLDLQPTKKRRGMGTCRAIRAEKVVERLKDTHEQ